MFAGFEARFAGKILEEGGKGGAGRIHDGAMVPMGAADILTNTIDTLTEDLRVAPRAQNEFRCRQIHGSRRRYRPSRGVLLIGAGSSRPWSPVGVAGFGRRQP